MDVLNGLLTLVFDLLLYPLRAFGLAIQLAFIAIVTGLFMLAIFRWTSHPQNVRQLKNQLKAHLLELRLYKDDIGLSLAAMKEVLGANLRYMLSMMKPMLVLMAPTMLVVIQLAARFEHRPLTVNESVIITLKLQNKNMLDHVSLEAPAGITVETPPLRISQKNQIDWRVKAVAEGQWNINFHLGNEFVTKKLIVGSQLMCLSPSRFGGQFLDQLLNPAEPSLPSTSFAKEIHVQYPHREFSLLGWKIHWLVAFFAFSATAAFVMKGVFGVEM